MLITLSDYLKFDSEKYPENIALRYKGSSITYKSLNDEVNKVASLLLKIGLEKKDRVAIYLEKSPEEVISLLAINRAGGVFVDIHHQQKSPQVLYILNDSGAKVFITTRQRCNNIKNIFSECPELKYIIVHGNGESLSLPNIRVVDLASVVPNAKFKRNIIENDICCLYYTSGSTGKPKGVILSNRNVIVSAESAIEFLEHNAGDKVLSVLPFSFDYGLAQLTQSICSGGTCVLLNYIFPRDILNELISEKITAIGMLPTLWLQLLQLDWDYKQLPHLRYITNSSSKLPEAAVKELRRRLPNTKFYLMYGLTEAFRATYLSPDKIDRKPTSIGQAIPNVELFIINKDGKKCGPGEEGELVQRGPHVALGYWNNLETTNSKFKNNPFSTPEVCTKEIVVYSGDRVVMDEEGDIYFIGRYDELIKSSGYRVSPTEIEEALYNIKEINLAAVFGVPDDIIGQKIVAVISLREETAIDVAKIKLKCNDILPNYMVPREIEIWDTLPLTPVGKIDRVKIKNDFMEKQKNE